MTFAAPFTNRRTSTKNAIHSHLHRGILASKQLSLPIRWAYTIQSDFRIITAEVLVVTLAARETAVSAILKGETIEKNQTAIKAMPVIKVKWKIMICCR